ncbi:MAG: hypothetical protein ACFFBP_22065 [Promethearchaeota archaeon]
MNSNDIENSEEPLRRTFIFLFKHSRTPEAFSKEEFKEFARYPNPSSFDTYFSKKFRHFLEEAPNENNKYLVSDIFKEYSRWEKFKIFCSQSSKLKVNYFEEYYKDVMIFEFFLPLTNENNLRSTLDDLFYKDTVKLALNKIIKRELHKVFLKKKRRI